MNNITNSGSKHIALALAAFVFIALSLAIAPKAQAADLWGGESFDFYPIVGGQESFDFYPISGGAESFDFYPMDTYDYGYGGGSSYYGGMGGFGGYSTPSYWTPPRYTGTSGGGQSQSQSQAQSSNNTNVNNNIITINGIPYTQNPVVNPPVVQYPVCTLFVSTTYIQRVGQAVTLTWSSTYASWGTISGIGNVATNGSMTVYPNTTTTYTGTFYGTNGQAVTCSATVTLAPTYNPVYPVNPTTPYVTLSAAPYTGLEMGPVGTALYWSFLVLWCLVAAYLIVVKRVQNVLVSKLNSFLFAGKSATVTHSHASHAPTSHVSRKATPVVAHEDAIDPFIASQISR